MRTENACALHPLFLQFQPQLQLVLLTVSFVLKVSKLIGHIFLLVYHLSINPKVNNLEINLGSKGYQDPRPQKMGNNSSQPAHAEAMDSRVIKISESVAQRLIVQRDAPGRVITLEVLAKA